MPDGPVDAILCLKAAERNDQTRIRDIRSVGGNFVRVSRTRISEANLGGGQKRGQKNHAAEN
jgi:hypothetical protein